jgi:preprotein translocase subunit SecY
VNKALLRQLYTNKDLRKRILIVLGILAIYAVLTNVPVPVPDTNKLQNFLLKLFQSSPLLGFANLFTGGAMSRFSIILMGLGPYINASIIIQLLTQVVPKLNELQKEGESGRAKINHYTRLLTVPLAIIQSIAMVAFVRTLSVQVGGVDVIGGGCFGPRHLLLVGLGGGACTWSVPACTGPCTNTHGPVTVVVVVSHNARDGLQRVAARVCDCAPVAVRIRLTNW